MQVNRNTQLIIFIFGLIVLIPGIGIMQLFDWDEANFAEMAREMLITKNYTFLSIAYSSFAEKPPLFIWLQMVSMKIFGITAFAARLPNAIIGAITMASLYGFGSRYKGHFFGIMWVLAYACMPAFLYFKSGLIDPLFNLFIVLAALQLHRMEHSLQNFENPKVHAALFGLFTGLALLTKGPVALVILGLLWFSRLLFSISSVGSIIKQTLLSALVFTLVVLSWVGPMLDVHGTDFFVQFYNYHVQLAQGFIEWHNQPWFYHVAVLLVVCFPISIFCWPALFKTYSPNVASYELTMKWLFWIVLIIFSVVTTKIIHYSSLCWYSLSFFAAAYFYNQYTVVKAHKKRHLAWGLLLIGVPLGLVLGAVTLLKNGLSLENLPIKLDTFTQNQLMEKVIWPWPLALIGLGFGILYFWFFLQQLKRKNNNTWFNAAISSFVVWQLVYFLILPGVQMHTQSRLVNKIQSIAANKGLQHSLDFKSYNQYFYGKIMPNDMKLRTAEGTEIDYRNRDIYNWYTELSVRAKNRDFYLWVKEESNFKNDQTWKKIGLYNGYTLFKKKH